MNVFNVCLVKKRIVHIAESKTVKLSGSFKNGEMGNMENDISSERAGIYAGSVYFILPKVRLARFVL